MDSWVQSGPDLFHFLRRDSFLGATLNRTNCDEIPFSAQLSEESFPPIGMKRFNVQSKPSAS
ncbi:MAG: hypothetical protein KC931_04285, partial [Candidatus Omnitrophica bacterium]|nr:hypothetical protein [Candidatus Omnitrophota bacterium]